MPESAIKFYAFEYLKRQISSDGESGTIGERFVAGAMAGVISQASIYPLEVAKTRLAVAATGEYNGIFHCLSKVYTTEGFFALFKGISPSLIGIIPYAGVDLTVNNSTFQFVVFSHFSHQTRKGLLHPQKILAKEKPEQIT